MPLAPDWQADPLVATLPERLGPTADADALGSAVFDAGTDVRALRDQRWLADIASFARGDAVEEVDIAVNLFRWTVRSLALVSDPPMNPSESTPGSRGFLPGEILLSGRASAAQRAWIFLELVRHAGLDGVMLATGDADRGGLRAWIPAVVAQGDLWLFEPTYGLPIPGPDGTGVATVRQAAADPAILGRLSTSERPYPVQAGDIEGLSVLVAADPWSLSRRMRAVSEQLVGSRGMTLSLDASAVGRRAADALVRRPSSGVAADAGSPAGPRVALWEFPWETILRRTSDAARVQVASGRELAVMSLQLFTPADAEGLAGRRTTRVVRPLYAARLREFRGELDGPDGAKVSYLAARPGRQAIAAAVAASPPQQADGVRRLFEQMKEDATYWLGVLTLAEGENATAADYLGRMTLEAAPDSRWTDAARVNLAQALLGLGRTAEAVELLRADASPQRFGSRLRAERLETESRGATISETPAP
ncbi:MAG: tetratricopeptide repeat protein [Planctomycetia bacterium]